MVNLNEKMEQKLRKEEIDEKQKIEKLEKKRKKALERLKKKQLKAAEEFKDKIVKKFGKIVKSVVIFGSFARGDFNEKSDVDLLVIIDDTTARFTEEMKNVFDKKIQEIGKSISKDINVQPSWTLTEFWEMARIGHPLLYTIVRDGWALYDTGFFIPTRKLLELGKIPGTIEAVSLLIEGAPKKIQRVEMAKLYMVAEDVYYAMLNSSQAVLMYMGVEAPAPKHIVSGVEKHLVKNKLLKRKYLSDLRKIVQFRKDVEHKKITKISGRELDKFIKVSKSYLKQMLSIFSSLEKKKKENIIIKNYEIMIKAVVATLKKLDKLPEDPADLPRAIEKELIETGLIKSSYRDLFKKVITMRKMVAEKKENKISEKDVQLTREYVRRFVRDISKIIEDIENGKTSSKKKRLSKRRKGRRKK